MSDEFVEDPLFRQRYRFAEAGDSVRVEMWTEPGGGVTSTHFHPRAVERFEVHEGEVTFEVAGLARRAGPGERLVVEAGVAHSFRNTGPGAAHLVAEASPALDLRASIEEGAAMARAGKLTARGRPKGFSALLEAADFAQRYRETVVLTSPPPWLQRVLFPPLAWLHRRGRRRRER